MTLRTLTPIKKYGITERKKAELDNLTIEVLDAQHEVQQLTTIVEAFKAKYTKFLNFLKIAEENRAQALAAKDLLDEVVQNAFDLRSNSDIAFNEIVNADAKIKEVAQEMRDVMDKLIYTAEMINRLATIVVRKKVKNPLISDELITMIQTVGKDANNAVALTLVALKSTFASQAANMESEAAASLEYSQSMKLYEILTRTNAKGEINPEQKVSLKSLLYEAYETSKTDYRIAHKASNDALKQLNHAKAQLNKATVNWKSLSSGLTAATAAALAS